MYFFAIKVGSYAPRCTIVLTRRKSKKLLLKYIILSNQMYVQYSGGSSIKFTGAVNPLDNLNFMENNEL